MYVSVQKGGRHSFPSLAIQKNERFCTVQPWKRGYWFRALVPEGMTNPGEASFVRTCLVLVGISRSAEASRRKGSISYPSRIPGDFLAQRRSALEYGQRLPVTTSYCLASDV